MAGGGNQPALPLIGFVGNQSAAYNAHLSIVRMQFRRPLTAKLIILGDIHKPSWLFLCVFYFKSILKLVEHLN